MHEFKNEAERVFDSGIHSDKRYEVLSTVFELPASQCLLKQPLPITSGKQSMLG
jgi:hypothetical protein